jgi:CO dehydrogenase/acetyl-CoA synthase beta subunit
MNKWMVGCFVVVCFVLALFPAKWYADSQNVLEHPKGMAWVTMKGVYVNGSADAVFVGVSVDDAPDGFVNFNRAVIEDGDYRIVTVNNSLNISIAMGQSGTLRVNCNCTVLEDYVVLIGDSHNTWSHTITKDGMT